MVYGLFSEIVTINFRIFYRIVISIKKSCRFTNIDYKCGGRNASFYENNEKRERKQF